MHPLSPRSRVPAASSAALSSCTYRRRAAGQTHGSPSPSSYCRTPLPLPALPGAPSRPALLSLSASPASSDSPTGLPPLAPARDCCCCWCWSWVACRCPVAWLSCCRVPAASSTAACSSRTTSREKHSSSSAGVSGPPAGWGSSAAGPAKPASLHEGKGSTSTSGTTSDAENTLQLGNCNRRSAFRGCKLYRLSVLCRIFMQHAAAHLARLSGDSTCAPHANHAAARAGGTPPPWRHSPGATCG